jgi:outer membrane lipoprotein-sorting protein
MNWRKQETVSVLAATGVALALAICSGSAQQGPAQGAQAAPGPKMAEEVYKNIQVLKGVPADQVLPAMQFISASLGVECEHCHVEREFQKDDKQPKQIARKMMQMMFAINKENFRGRREVTCYSCHHGSKDPLGIPLVADEDFRPARGEEREGGPLHGGASGGRPASPGEVSPQAGPNAPALPAADQFLDKYLHAVGGADALRKITSRIEKGTLTAFGGRHFPIEVFAKAPDKRLSVMHLPDGESITAFDGHEGWLSGTRQPVHVMTGAETEAARLDADFYFPAHVRDVFSQFRVRPPETVGDHEANIVLGLNSGQPPVKLYFDEQSGLLVRMVRYAETPLGLNPTQIDYADFRDAQGVKVPYRWTLARPGGRFTIQIDEIQQNVPIDDAEFAKPAAPAAERQQPPAP